VGIWYIRDFDTDEIGFNLNLSWMEVNSFGACLLYKTEIEAEKGGGVQPIRVADIWCARYLDTNEIGCNLNLFWMEINYLGPYFPLRECNIVYKN